MPARDTYHDEVIHALQKDSWTVTHDPLRIRWGKKDLYIDLGAEQLIAAEADGRRIAVEVKSFIGASPLADLEQALGQFRLYRSIMKRTEPDRELFAAIPEAAYVEVFQDPIGEALLQDGEIRLIVFHPEREEILRWIP